MRQCSWMRSGDWVRTIWGWVVWRRAACCIQLLIQGHLFKVQCVIHICQSTCFSSNSVSEGGSLVELWWYSMPKLLNTVFCLFCFINNIRLTLITKNILLFTSRLYEFFITVYKPEMAFKWNHIFLNVLLFFYCLKTFTISNASVFTL